MRKKKIFMGLILMLSLTACGESGNVENTETSSGSEELVLSENTESTTFDSEEVEALLQGEWLSYDSDSVYSLWVFSDGSYAYDTYVDGVKNKKTSEGIYTIEEDAIYTTTTSQSNVVEGSIPYHIEEGVLILDPDSGALAEKIESGEEAYANFVFVVASVSGKQSYTYSDYVYDNDIDQIVSYTVSGDEDGKYVLTYDDNGLLISKALEHKFEKYGTAVHTYTYYKNGTIKKEVESYTTENVREGTTFKYTHKLNKSGQIKKTTAVNVTSEDNYTMVYKYKYDDSGKKIREKQTSPNSTYIIDYTYDDFGNISTETSYKEDEPSEKSRTVYVYSLIKK